MNYKLENLSTEAAYEFLKLSHKISNLTASEKEEIAELTGNVPLALQIVQSLLNLHSSNPTKIIDGLRTERIATLSPSTRGIDACFNLSYKYLSQEEKVIGQFLSNFPGSFSTETCIAVLLKNNPTSTKIITDTLAVLVDRSLLETDHNGRYHFHCLIRDYFREKQKTSAYYFPTFTNNFQYHFFNLLETASTAYSEHSFKKTFAILDNDRHNFLQVFDDFENNSIIGIYFIQLYAIEIIAKSIENGLLLSRFSYTFLLNLVQKSVTYFDDESDTIFQYNSKKSLYLKVLYYLITFHEKVNSPEMAMKVFSKYKARFELFKTYEDFEVSDYVRILSVLNRICFELNYHDDFKHYHPTLINSSKKVIETCSNNGCSYNNIGYYYLLAEEYEAAIKYFKLSLTIESHTPILRLLILSHLHSAYRMTGLSTDADIVLNLIESMIPEVITLPHYEFFKNMELINTITWDLYSYGENNIANMLEECAINITFAIGAEVDEELYIVYPNRAMLVLYRLYTHGRYERVVELGIRVKEVIERKKHLSNAESHHKSTIKLQILIGKAKFFYGNYSEASKDMELSFDAVVNSPSFGNSSAEYWTCCRYLILHWKYFHICYGHSIMPNILWFFKWTVYIIFVQPLDVFPSVSGTDQERNDQGISYFPELNHFEWSSAKDIAVVNSELQEWLTQGFETVLPFTQQLWQTIVLHVGQLAKMAWYIFQFPAVRFFVNFVSIFIRISFVTIMLSFLEFFIFVIVLICFVNVNTISLRRGVRKTIYYPNLIFNRIYCLLLLNSYGKYLVLISWYFVQFFEGLFLLHVHFLIYHFLIYCYALKWIRKIY